MPGLFLALSLFETCVFLPHFGHFTTVKNFHLIKCRAFPDVQMNLSLDVARNAYKTLNPIPQFIDAP